MACKIHRVKDRFREPICAADSPFFPNAICIWKECGANPEEPLWLSQSGGFDPWGVFFAKNPG